jgi:hypothetical protein
MPSISDAGKAWAAFERSSKMGDGGKRELEVMLKRQQVILLPCALHVSESLMSWMQKFQLLCILFQLACQNAFNISPIRLEAQDGHSQML